MKERWLLEDVLALPDGEHDYFDRKSGQLISDSSFRHDMAKAVSAFANSGGGTIILGVADDGRLDGVPRKRGRTCVREWIEQVIPSLVEPVPTAIRVHLIEGSEADPVSDHGVVVVVDVGDSQHAPFQSRVNQIYYYRVGGHSRPAPPLLSGGT